MSKIFKNLLPFWKSVIIILALLLVQAWCDLSLPQYTSDIIDVGIQNSGVEHVLPEAVTKEEFETAKTFMTEDEITEWENAYEEDGDHFVRTENDGDTLDDLDGDLSMAFVMNYQMSMMDEATFKETIAAQMQMDPENLKDLSVEQIGQMLGADLTTFTREKEDDDGNKTEVTCVDVRPLFQNMLNAGMMQKSDLLSVRDEMEESFNAVGDTMIQSIGVAYAIQCDKDAGIDVDHIQTSYLWAEGLRMIGLALLMGVATVLVGLFASKVAAGVGMNLREGLFKKVVGFSNAEMDHFSTASLITRSTNDVQQIQMVTVLLLRMVIYAPILGIGGIIKVSQTGAGMGWVIGLAVLVIMGFVSVLMAVTLPKFKLMQKLVDGLNLVSREILTGISVIRAFGREKTEEERFDEANTKLTKTMLFTNRVMTLMMPCMMFIMYGLTVLIVWVGAHKIDEGVLQVGAMTAFITYAMQIVMAFLMLTMMSIMLPRAGVAANRIDEVLKTKSTVTDAKEPESLTAHNGKLTFSHVNFRYPGAEENVLCDIDFTAEPVKNIWK